MAEYSSAYRRIVENQPAGNAIAVRRLIDDVERGEIGHQVGRLRS